MDLVKLYSDISSRLARGERTIIIIDGMAAAGKTTLAASLSERYSCCVIPMDHFFLRPEQRTPERLSAPGGNIDYERFANEVLPSLDTGRPFSYRSYDCSVQRLCAPVNVDPGRLLVVEGSYSYLCMYVKAAEHGFFVGDFASNIRRVSVFLEIDETAQRDRLFKRDPVLFERFIDEWLPMERIYFEHFDVKDKCDYVLYDN